MQGSAIAPPHQVPQIRWLIAALVLGAAGSMVAIGAFGSDEYRVGSLIVEMKMKPSSSGTTELAVRPIRTLPTGFAEANTHIGFLSFRGTIIGVYGESLLEEATLATANPKTLATYIQDQGESAIRRFLLRIGVLTLAGGAAGGLIIALFGMRVRRVFQGVLAGVVLVGVLGLVAWQTYDIEKFDNVQYRQAGRSLAPPG